MDGIKCDGRNNLKKLINVMDGRNVMEGKISKKYKNEWDNQSDARMND